MASLSSDHISSTHHAKKVLGGAATVEYEDDFEKANASLQVAWTWDKTCDDLHTDEEVSELAHIFENTFRYKVTRKLLNSKTDKLPHQQLMKYIADFLYHEDENRTLLLVYYAGHGSPKSADNGDHGLTLSGQRTPFDDRKEVNEIVWESIERNLNHTRGDVLEIFDCCYAGDLGRTGQTWSRRCFEFLGACSSGNTTLSPGPRSFTKALIWALNSLARDESKFTISVLSRKIREAPNFPKNQVPVQMDRGAGSIERIILTPLPQTTGQTESSLNEPQTTEPQGLLNLNFIFDKPPTEASIIQFGENLNKFINREKMPVDRIVWGGLTSWGARSQKMKVAKAFKAAFLERRSERKQREMIEMNSTRVLTPASSGEEEPLSPNPPSDSLHPPTKKRRLSNEH